VNSSNLLLVRSGADAGSVADLMANRVRGCTFHDHPVTVVERPCPASAHRPLPHLLPAQNAPRGLVHAQAQHRAAGR